MKRNAYVILGIVLIIIGLTTQIQFTITDVGGTDNTPPEYDLTYMVPANNTNYYVITPNNPAYQPSPFPAAQILVRDLESGIHSVTFQMWGRTINYNIQVSMMKWKTYNSGWEAWTYNWTMLNPYPPAPTTPGQYSFYFTIENNIGLKSSLGSFGRWQFSIVTKEQPPTSGELLITFTINSQLTQEQALFQITGPPMPTTPPSTYSDTRYGNNFLIPNLPAGTYQVNATYNNQVQLRQAQITSGQRSSVNFDFQTSNNNNVTPELPKMPIAYNAGEIIAPSQILPLSGVILVSGAIVLVMGFRKKTRAS